MTEHNLKANIFLSLLLVSANEPATAQIYKPSCIVVCPDNKFMNKETCSCDDHMPKKPCVLVCGSDEELDAKTCQCNKL